MVKENQTSDMPKKKILSCFIITLSEFEYSDQC